MYAQIASESLKVSDMIFPSFDDSLDERRKEVLSLCRQLLPKEWLRGDYKELVQLVILYLDGQILAGDDVVAFQRPGALHKARFMSKLIYSFKIVLLSSKINTILPRGSVFGKDQLPKLERFVQFVALCYVPWWLTCPLAADAPINDLKLLRRLQEYGAVDAVIAEAAEKAFSRHLWYLTEELVPLCLFSEDVTEEDKATIAKELLQLPKDSPLKRCGEGFGKPILPSIDSDVRDMISLFGPDSWIFFNLLKLDHTFLADPPREWNTLDSYARSKEIIDNLFIVNDTAERGVKLASDFLSGAKKETSFQNILQVVENHRKSLPNQRKPKQSSKNWFLCLESC